MNKPQLAGVNLIFIILTSLSTEAKIFHWPAHCDKGNLQITNSSNENQYVWLQSFTEKLESETEFEIDSHSTLNISVEKMFTNERNSILQFADRLNLNSKFFCDKSAYKTDDRDGGSQIYTKSANSHHKLYLQNLSSLKNAIEVMVSDKNNQKIYEKVISLNSAETFSLSLDEFKNWKNVKVISDLKYSSFLFTENENLDPKSQPPVGITSENGAYFLVGVREIEDDSFVVKIEDLKLINQARELLAKPESEKIVFGKIKAGHQSYNRNFNNKSKTFWSWSVSEVTGFGDFGSTACNGHPQAVEDRVESWTTQPGKICFWDYRLIKELSAEEVKTGILKP